MQIPDHETFGRYRLLVREKRDEKHSHVWRSISDNYVIELDNVNVPMRVKQR